MDDWKLKAQVVVEIETEYSTFVSSYLYKFVFFKHLCAFEKFSALQSQYLRCPSGVFKGGHGSLSPRDLEKMPFMLLRLWSICEQL